MHNLSFFKKQFSIFVSNMLLMYFIIPPIIQAQTQKEDLARAVTRFNEGDRNCMMVPISVTP